MEEIKKFNSFMDIQGNIFREIFENVDVKLQKPPPSQYNLMISSALSLRNTELEGSIQEVKDIQHISPTQFTIKKGLKRLDTKIGQPKDAKGIQQKPKKIKKETLKISSKSISCEPKVELID